MVDQWGVMSVAIQYPTKNDLSENCRETMIFKLNECLATASHLVIQSKQAHWNVKGPHFLLLHELFDKLYEQANDWADLIAERLVQLGGIANGTLKGISSFSKLQPYPLDIASGKAHIRAIVNSILVFAKMVRNAISSGDQAGDLGTADLFTEISRAVDKMLWFFEAHLHANE